MTYNAHSWTKTELQSAIRGYNSQHKRLNLTGTKKQLVDRAMSVKTPPGGWKAAPKKKVFASVKMPKKKKKKK